MRAILTSDLFHQENAKLSIRTCAEMLNYMPEIYAFIKDIGVEAKLTSDMFNASLILRGDNLIPNLDNIVRFIESKGWRKD